MNRTALWLLNIDRIYVHTCQNSHIIVTRSISCPSLPSYIVLSLASDSLAIYVYVHMYSPAVLSLPLPPPNTVAFNLLIPFTPYFVSGPPWYSLWELWGSPAASPFHPWMQTSAKTLECAQNQPLFAARCASCGNQCLYTGHMHMHLKQQCEGVQQCVDGAYVFLMQ